MGSEVDDFDQFLDERDEEELEHLLLASEIQDVQGEDTQTTSQEHEEHDNQDVQAEDDVVVMDFDVSQTASDAHEKQVDQRLQQLWSSSTERQQQQQQQKKKKGRPMSRDFLVQEVVDSRMTELVSDLLNKFGTVISVPNRQELKARVKENVEKERTRMRSQEGTTTAAKEESELESDSAPAMFTLEDLTPSLQRKTVLLEHVVGELVTILEKSAMRQATMRRQRTELRKYVVAQQNEIKRMHDELRAEKRKCSRLRKAREKERQFLLQEIEQHRQTIARLTESDPPPAPDMSQLIDKEDIDEDSDDEFSIASALSKTVLGSVLGWTQQPQPGTAASASQDAGTAASTTLQPSQPPQSLQSAAESVSSVLTSFSTWWTSGSGTTTTTAAPAPAPTSERGTASRSPRRQRETSKSQPLQLKQHRPPTTTSSSTSAPPPKETQSTVVIEQEQDEEAKKSPLPASSD